MKSRLKSILLTSLPLCLTVFTLHAQNATQFGNLPLWFEAGSTGHFIAHGAKSAFTVTPTGTEFTLAKESHQTAQARLQLVGANPAARITGEAELSGKLNYFVGNNPSQWQANVPTFSKVQVENVYPGINVVYYGNQQKLEYDFNLDVGANPSAIALRFDGAENISLNSHGALIIQFKDGAVVQHAPLAYQTIQGHQQIVAADYKMLDAHTVTFALGDYDHRHPLVIDPVLTYSTYFGGNYGDTAWAIAVSPVDGSIYVAGQTLSTQVSNNIPLSTPNAFQTSFQGGNKSGDAFVAKFDYTGTNLIYATYIGGNADDVAYALAVDNAGHAYVAGTTDSPNFPTRNAVTNATYGGNAISGTLDPTKHYPFDAFVTELGANGSNLVYSTYLGGSSSETVLGIALDTANNAFVTGYTFSTNFPVTPNAFQPHLMCTNTSTYYFNANAFVSKIGAGGSTLNYSTYLGGTNYDVGRAIAFNNNRVFVAGYTLSTNFPNTNHLTGFDYLNGSTNKHTIGSDGFVTAFSSSVTNLSLLYSTLLGGSNYDAATSIAAAADGSAYVAGYTTSTNFPYTTTNVANLSTAYVLTNTGAYWRATNGFLTQIKWDGSHPSIGYSAVFGGKGMDIANGVALDPNGNAYVVGSASSTNFPTTASNISGYLSVTNSSPKKKGYSDAFIIAFNTNASALLYSAYLGGRENDFGNAIAVDPLGNAYIAGQTLSTNFPSVNAWQTQRDGTNDMFIAKISQTLVPPVPALTILPPSPNPGGIELKWKMFPANYNLEGATDLSASNWVTVPQTPVYSNGWYQLILHPTNNLEYFRLHQD